MLHHGVTAPAPAAFAERTSELRDALARIRACAYVTDAEQYGRLDLWAVPDEADCRGDCEDLALLAHQTLVTAGWPRQSLRIMVRPGYDGYEPHAVLCVWIEGESTVCLDNTRRRLILLRLLPGAWWPA